MPTACTEKLIAHGASAERALKRMSRMTPAQQIAFGAAAKNKTVARYKKCLTSNLREAQRIHAFYVELMSSAQDRTPGAYYVEEIVTAKRYIALQQRALKAR